MFSFFARNVVFVVLALVVALPAYAQSPCARGPASIKMAGQDLDEMRCTLAIALGEAAQLTAKAIKLEAQHQLLQGDLTTAAQRSQATAKWWSDWWKATYPDKEKSK